MTKKDYELIAGAVARTRMAARIGKKETADDAVRLVAVDLSATLAAANPRFDRERFLAACGFRP